VHPSSSSNGYESRHEPIAIVGIGCRLPGAANASELWDLLNGGIDAIGEYPGGRFPLLDAAYAGALPGAEVATRAGGFLTNIDKFDASFFGISSREAPFLDPQHRVFLETAWEAIEDAGITRNALAGTQTGVFAGLWSSDYETCVRESAPEADFHSTIGTGRYSLSGRLSYIFDLRGPSLTIDTGCSSALAAVHLGCRSIHDGDCELALAGGTNLILRPEITLAYSAAGMLSREGRCRFGDAGASGYVRSEGSAIVVLKPLARALADGDRIYAVVRGGAVNNDGSSSGLLVSPSRIAQAQLIRRALADAAVPASRIEYVEAHGTGTPAGDPVEIEAIGAALGGDREQPVLIGSIKTNIGHTEAAAGVAGLIKTALALHHGKIPRSLHFRDPNPKIAWNSLPVKIASEASSWNGKGPHFAAVSSFGITGTNACVIVESAPAETARSAPQGPVHLLAISAHAEDALKQAARGWQKFLRCAPQDWLSDICYTAARRRTHQDYRLSVVGGDARAIAETLGAWAEGEQAAGVLSSRVRAIENWKLAFVFSGVGGQWPGMCSSLLRENSVFRQRLLECRDSVLRHGGPDVVSEILATADRSRLAAAEIVQPAIWAVQLAAAKLWESLGFKPQAVVGHSMGEVTAAVVCGALSLDEGAEVVCRRSRVSKLVARAGGMALAGVSAATSAELIAPYEGKLWVAGINGSESTILAGDPDAIEQILADLNRREIFCRRINSDVASHSPHVEEASRELEAALTHLAPGRTSVQFYSTSTGQLEDGCSLDAAYWGGNLRQPVLFWPTLKAMLADGCNAIVEIGPHPILLHSIQETIGEEKAEAVAVASLYRHADEYTQTLAATAALHNSGYGVDFSQLYSRGRCVSLPAYAWQRERHWIETREPRVHAEVPADHMYELHWREIPAPSGSTAGPRRVVVFGHGATKEPLAAALCAHGCEVVVADDDGTLEDALQQGAISDVIHLVSPDIPDTGELDLTALWRAQSFGTERLIHTIQLLSRNRTTSAPRLWILTSGTLPVEIPAGRFHLEHSSIAGLAGAIRREHPELGCRHMDVSEPAAADDILSVAELFLYGTVEETVVIRGRKLWAPRYERSRAVAAQPLELRGDATYLITGGLGGVGTHVAAWMAGRGARHIVLTGRRAPSPQAAAHIGKLQDAGVEVRVAAADLSRDSETAALFSAMAGMPPLRGIFHAAAVIDDALLAAATPDQVSRVMAPKAAGAWNLHRHTLGVPLDFFVLCSSLAVPVSQPGQGVYAAANSFLDAFAAWRRSLGLPTTSIQWAVWADTGLAKETGTRRSAADYLSRGIRSLSPDLGVGILGAALGSDCACVLAAPVSWNQFAEFHGPDGDPPRIFSTLVPSLAKTESQAGAVQSFATRLAELKPAERPQALQEHLLEHLAAVLKTSAARIDVLKPLGTLGLDSLLSLELVRRLSASTGVKLPATAVFNYPTAKALAAEIARRMGVAEVTSPVQAASTAVPSAAIAQLSEEEAILALMTSPRLNTQ
jgi:acyl transferase domain-containing protein/NADP-dependent 3-hydroxy acid dehydrogenase YdfG/acyl carrier protein